MFFCLEDCREPDCRGCDPNKVSLDTLREWVAYHNNTLIELQAVLWKREAREKK